MKIGILTFHSQLNYGGVLQCWALQTALEKMGHEVVVIDREFEHQIRSVAAIFKGWTWKRFIKFAVKLMLRRPDALRTVRYIRTVRFVQKNLHLTEYSFKKWENAPSDLGVDLIVVGSDQVWNGIWQDPGVYLLEDAPAIPAIGYAISLGMTSLPSDSMERYITAAKRFSSISVRETEAKTLLKPAGIDAVHVADPTLLMPCPKAAADANGGLVCYFIDIGLIEQSNIDLLDGFGRKFGIPVQIFSQKLPYGTFDSKGIRIRYSAGPEQFYKTISSAKYIISDSFHALMFACIFGKPICLVDPGASQRRHMFSRIREFSDNYVKGQCIFRNLDEALENIAVGLTLEYDYAGIDMLKKNSIAWLVQSIECARK